jgi:cellobiose phosphorylase
MSPCIPAHWSHFELVFAYHDARYEIRVENPAGVNRGIAAVEIDGLPISPVHGRIPLCADARTHRVLVTLGTSAPR